MIGIWAAGGQQRRGGGGGGGSGGGVGNDVMSAVARNIKGKKRKEHSEVIKYTGTIACGGTVTGGKYCAEVSRRQVLITHKVKYREGGKKIKE
ncbi:hypothetical protein E2C01_009314 [Portunus trituberculatus]|uniref:Uncharacterized protein n=1 Tax=Portunus trituberculatus TaxID=210409 RepID=A0A5B7D488_PORTR|nr:hypothetical protein [Portunus trituberculatus]